MTKPLDKIYRYFSQQESLSEMELTDLFLDSRQVTKNSVFVAIQGYQSHGNQFIDKAIDQGAGLIITDKKNISSLDFPKGVYVLYFPNLAAKLGDFASWFYRSPSQRIKVVGITGTNGKTSVAFYTAQLLQDLGNKVALMGTLGNGLLQEIEPSINTTLDVISLNRYLNKFIEQGANWCVMEVSSHAIVLQRIAGIHFQTVALTQVTRDHLDFHGSIANYHAAKRQLFLEFPAENTVINLDDKQGQLIQEMTQATNVLSYAIANSAATLKASQLEFDDLGLSFKASYINSKDEAEKASIKSQLMGNFSVENLLCSIGILLVNGMSLYSVSLPISRLKSVAGRMEKIHSQPAVLIDYAHTPDALEAVLKSLRVHSKKTRLILVFGCGGDRDQGKRPLMGAIAENYADKVILTNDNPRGELPETIVEHILAGMNYPNRSCDIFLDRKLAIETALEQAKNSDIVMIAGKGHENYQELNGVRTAFSDQQVVLNWYLNHASACMI